MLSVEMEGADLGDKRLNRRLRALVGRIGDKPDGSLPRVLDDAELEAAYRFVNNEKVTPAKVLEPHVRETLRRCAERGSVVVAHDTTEFAFSGNARRGLGRLRTTGQGYFGHFALAVGDADGREVLGVLAAHTWVRGPRKKKTGGSRRSNAPDREMTRWWETVAATQDLLDGVAEALNVADREADAFECLAMLQARKARHVIRLAHDRVVECEKGTTKLSDALEATETLAERTVTLSARKAKGTAKERKIHPPRSERVAKLAVSAVRVSLKRPSAVPSTFPERLPVNVVRVREVDLPEGETPIEWRLVTTEPIDTAEQVLAVVDAYRARWLIEEFFKALKTGCQIERRQNESLDALLNMLAVLIPVAWNLLRVRMLARVTPEAPASTALTPAQIQILQTHPRTRKRMSDRPTMRQALLAIAALGGHLLRNGEPGWATLGHGYETLLLLEQGWLMGQSGRSHQPRASNSSR